MAFSDCRPMRPKPLIPTRTAITYPPGERCRARSTVRGYMCGPSAAPGGVAETRDHEWVSASQAHVRAELGADDLDPAAGRTEGGGSDRGPSRTEKPLALSVRDRAADHDSGGVERVDEPDAGDSECASTALHDVPARLIAGVLAFGDVTRFDGVHALLGRTGRQEGALPISHA